MWGRSQQEGQRSIHHSAVLWWSGGDAPGVDVGGIGAGMRSGAEESGAEGGLACTWSTCWNGHCSSRRYDCRWRLDVGWIRAGALLLALPQTSNPREPSMCPKLGCAGRRPRRALERERLGPKERAAEGSAEGRGRPQRAPDAAGGSEAAAAAGAAMWQGFAAGL